MTIGELAKKAGVNRQTIRYYEREAILPPPRRRIDSGYRDYDEDTLYKIRFIKQAKHAGLKLYDVKRLFELEVLPQEACYDVKSLLVERIDEVAAKILELRTFSKTLKRLRQSCEVSVDGRCAVLAHLRNEGA